jgi:hypothetical protein
MRSAADRRVVAHLAAGGLSVCEIVQIAAIPRSTIVDWLRRPSGGRPADADVLHALPRAPYSYLLGFYLGDGTISSHPRGVYRLRIVSDARYPGIIDECAAAMQAVMPENRVAVKRLPSRATEISCYSKRWPLLFPQHGPGRKHERRIVLEPWQEEIVAQPRESSSAG